MSILFILKFNRNKLNCQFLGKIIKQKSGITTTSIVIKWDVALIDLCNRKREEKLTAFVNLAFGPNLSSIHINKFLA